LEGNSFFANLLSSVPAKAKEFIEEEIESINASKTTKKTNLLFMITPPLQS